MPAKHKSSHVFHAAFQFAGNESAEAGGVKHSGHADHALARKATQLVGGLAMASSGFDTTIRMHFGEYFTTLPTTSAMILWLVLSRSSRLMPGLRGIPAVITTMSELAVSA